MEDNKIDTPIRIASIGIRSIPPSAGSAGGDKVMFEYCKRLVNRGFQVIAYNRVYNNEGEKLSDYCGIGLIYKKTVNRAGFDTLIHSAKATFHIIFRNTADRVIIANGGNSIWGLFLRLFGKKVIVWVDGIDWNRDKWPWYGKLFLYLSAYLTAVIPHTVIFDNIFGKEIYEKKFRKKFEFIKNGADVSEFQENDEILKKYSLLPGEYLLFVGRFIPDKGLHYLIPAFEQVNTSKKLILVGGAPNPSDYEKNFLQSEDQRIQKLGYIYGNDVLNLIKHAYLYVQPSDVEGLSPVIQQVMGLGTPLLCSNIQENLFVVGDTAQTFRKGDIKDLREKINFCLANPDIIRKSSIKAKEKMVREFSWEPAIDQLIELIKS